MIRDQASPVPRSDQPNIERSAASPGQSSMGMDHSGGDQAPIAEITAAQSQTAQQAVQPANQPAAATAVTGAAASAIAAEWRFARRHWLFAAMVAVFLATS